MFDHITAGTTVRLHFTGSTQGLAMRAFYVGHSNGKHHLTGLGVMADAKFTVVGNRLGNGRTLLRVEVV